MRTISILLIAAAFLFTSCEKETVEKPITNSINIHLCITNVSSTTPLLVAYGEDFGNYQSPYKSLDTLTVYYSPNSQIKDLNFLSEFERTYIFISPLDSGKLLGVRNSNNQHWVEYPAGYTSFISSNDSLLITITN